MKKITVLTGAGISAESGLKTFRDSGGLWEEYNIRDVATPQAWDRNPRMVLEFYNKRREQVISAQPNAAHKALVDLENKYDVRIITQNIDDLHEKAGSQHIIHLHGEIMKVQSSVDPSLVYPLKKSRVEWGETCSMGSQLRPHVVWFGETVPNMDIACQLVEETDILIIIGTSLNVYPAAGLINYTPELSIKYIIDTNEPTTTGIKKIVFMRGKAATTVPVLVERLLAETD